MLPSKSTISVQTGKMGMDSGDMKELLQAPRPSSSVILLNSKNEVLLLQRIRHASSFAAAHVFPGGALSTYHEGPISDAEKLQHPDADQYRHAAIRETFEESGILLAREAGSSNSSLLSLPQTDLAAARLLIHDDKIKFSDWLQSVGGRPDLARLIPFTRWITPLAEPRRFTTQMYLYLLPLDESPSAAPIKATSDGGKEHTEATFASAQEWVRRAKEGEIVLFPPQLYLLDLVARCTQSGNAAEQRLALLELVRQAPEGSKQGAVPYSDMWISPVVLGRLPDRRAVLGLDRKLMEGRGGDGVNAVAVKFSKEGPRYLEVLGKGEAMRRIREAETTASDGSKL